MKKSTLFLIPVVVALYLMISGYGGGPNLDYPGGAPAGYTGSPNDGKNCTNCHGGSASTVAGQITSNIPAAGYTPGTTYTITVTVSGSGNKGFEVSPQNAAGTYLGTLIAGTNSHITGTKYITHSATQTGTAVWNFQWTAPALGTGTVTFYGACVASKPVTKLSTLVVNENSVLPLAVTATATPSSILTGQSSQLSMTASGGSGTYTYSWTSNPAGFTSTLQNPTVTPAVTTVYTAHVSDGTNNATNTTTVTVTAPPPLSVNASAFPTTITLGNSSQLSAMVTGGSGSYNFSWTSLPAGFTSTSQNPTVSPIVTTQYNVSVFDGTSTQTANTTVTVNAAPMTVNATAAPNVICAGQSTQLNAVASGGTGSYTYNWTSVPAGFTSTLQSPSVSPTSSTAYSVSVSDGTSSANGSANVTVNQPVTTNAGIDTTYCVNITSFQNNGTVSNYASVWWTTSGDGSFANANTLASTYTPGAGDRTALSVTLTLTASPLSPCSGNVTDTRHIAFDPCSGIQSLESGQLSVRTFPNPSQGIFTLEVTNLQNQDMELTISDIQGKEVSRDHISGSLAFTKQVDMSTSPKGVYILKVQAGSRIHIQKVVLE